MAKIIEEISIKSYRGIANFSLGNLGKINIITGDNNCGKTSLLEAIQIMSRPADFANVVMISRQRERFRMMPHRLTQSQFFSFINIFNKTQPGLDMSITCKLSGERYVTVLLTGEIVESLVNEEQIQISKPMREAAIDEQVNTFMGKFSTMFHESPNTHFNKEGDMCVDVQLNKYTKIMRSSISAEGCALEYISPIDHILKDRFYEITKNKELRENVINILQTSFDPDILDLRTVENNEGSTLRMIEHRVLGDMPLTTYGDGIKKVIALANAAATIKDGILLLDECETSIHTKAMSTFFRFLIHVCKSRNIQLFVTTHSDEALEKFIQCEDVSDDIRVITMYKNADNTTARVLNGCEALSVKHDLGLELRQ